MSPLADGPIKFNFNPDGSQSIMNLSRFGRSFSILKVPYAFKLLIQELQVMNVQMRIITEDNIDQLLSMSYSDNINKLMKSNNTTDDTIKEFNTIKSKIQLEPIKYDQVETPILPEPVNLAEVTPEMPISPPVAPGSPVNEQQPPSSPPFAPSSPVNQEQTPSSPPFAPGSPVNQGETSSSPPFAPGSPVQIENTSSTQASVLEVEKPPEETPTETENAEATSGSSGVKKIDIQPENNTATNNSSSNETKKITL